MDDLTSCTCLLNACSMFGKNDRLSFALLLLVSTSLARIQFPWSILIIQTLFWPTSSTSCCSTEVIFLQRRLDNLIRAHWLRYSNFVIQMIFHAQSSMFRTIWISVLYCKFVYCWAWYWWQFQILNYLKATSAQTGISAAKDHNSQRLRWNWLNFDI